MAPNSADQKLTKLMRAHWNESARTFDTKSTHSIHSTEQRQAWTAVLSSVVGPNPQRVLDVGCGTGVLSMTLAEMGHTVTGIDFAQQMLRVARQKAQKAGLAICFRFGNATALSDPDATYDLVIARHLIRFLPDPAGGVREWLRVLRPGGRLALIESSWASKSDDAGDPAPMRASPGESIRRVLRIFYYGAKEGRLTSIPAKLRELRYRRVRAGLPFFAGPLPDQLTVLLQEQGFRDITITSLMDPVLWGEQPQYIRYLAVARRPSDRPD